MKILTRYLVVEVIKTFLLSQMILSGVVVLVTTFQAVHRFNLFQLGFLLQLIPSLVARSLALTLPFSLLVGTTLTLGRLSAENEITAMKACGVHLGRLLIPLLVFGAFLSGLTYYLKDRVVPDSHVERRELLARALKSLLESKLTAGATTIDFFEGYRVTYAGIEGGEFRHLVIHRLDGVRVTQEIFASRARVDFDERRHRLRFILNDGSITRASDDPIVADDWKGTFEEQTVDIEIPTKERRGKVRPRYLTTSEIKKTIVEVEKEIERRREYVEEAVTDNDRVGGQLHLDEAIEERGKLETEAHLRLASSLASLLVVLVGAPLGILVKHGNKLVSFGVSTLPVFLVYYPLLIVGKYLGEQGSLSPFLSTWMANVALGSIGAALLWRTLRR